MSDKFRFKPEDFSDVFKTRQNSAHMEECVGIGLSGEAMEYVAQKSNTLLDEHLKTLPRVYGPDNDNLFEINSWWEKRSHERPDTHTAFLFNVEEIKKGK